MKKAANAPALVFGTAGSTSSSNGASAPASGANEEKFKSSNGNCSDILPVYPPSLSAASKDSSTAADRMVATVYGQETRRNRSGSAVSVASMFSAGSEGGSIHSGVPMRTPTSRTPSKGSKGFFGGDSNNAMDDKEKGNVVDRDDAKFSKVKFYRYSEKSYEFHCHISLDTSILLEDREALTGRGPNSDGPTALSPDALSMFSEKDPERDIRNMEVHQATLALCEALIPALVCPSSLLYIYHYHQSQ
jgi:hypothetical protein